MEKIATDIFQGESFHCYFTAKHIGSFPFICSSLFFWYQMIHLSTSLWSLSCNDFLPCNSASSLCAQVCAQKRNRPEFLFGPQSDLDGIVTKGSIHPSEGSSRRSLHRNGEERRHHSDSGFMDQRPCNCNSA